MGEIRDLAEPQRAYARRLARQRLHQPAFRTRVLLAYETRCAICELKHGALLDEVDGPMLRHGIQEMHGREIVLPRRRADRPDRDGLAWRWARFSAR